MLLQWDHRLLCSSPLEPVFFDYERGEVSPAMRQVLQRNADWLRRWPSTRIRLEGHTDERGTREYNLALGERQASAVRDYLVSLGVAGSRITAVSQGEESPFCAESNEDCWARNRRVQFVVTAK